MNEGWFGDDYLILFGEDEWRFATERYRIGETLPGYVVIGLRGWDEFVIRDAQGGTYTVPTVPLDAQYVASFDIPDGGLLKPDDRVRGRIKWYVKPLAFGGDPKAEDNVTWVTFDKHAELVAWWNAAYRAIKARGTL